MDKVNWAGSYLLSQSLNVIFLSLITAITAIASLIAIIAIPKSFLYLALDIIMAKCKPHLLRIVYILTFTVYVTCVFVSLNSRRRISDKIITASQLTNAITVHVEQMRVVSSLPYPSHSDDDAQSKETTV